MRGDDKAALVALYQATNGAQWHGSLDPGNHNWNMSSSPCYPVAWGGVTCFPASPTRDPVLWRRVRYLRLPFQEEDIGLSGTIPTQIGLLNYAEEMGMSGHRLSGTIPTQIGTLTELADRLLLYETALSGTIPTEAGSLSELQNLFLNNNALSGTIPTQLGLLNKLQDLSLWHNSLTGTIPIQIGLLDKLSDLDLSINALSGNLPTQIGHLLGLGGDNVRNQAGLGGYLRMNANSLSGTLPSELDKLFPREKFAHVHCFLTNSQTAPMAHQPITPTEDTNRFAGGGSGGGGSGGGGSGGGGSGGGGRGGGGRGGGGSGGVGAVGLSRGELYSELLPHTQCSLALPLWYPPPPTPTMPPLPALPSSPPLPSSAPPSPLPLFAVLLVLAVAIAMCVAPLCYRRRRLMQGRRSREVDA